MKNLHVFLIIAAVGMAVFGNSFQNDFVWDDEYLITNNTHVQAPSVKYALLFFKDNLGKYGEDENNFYRPLQELSYMLDYIAWKLEPAGYHLTNLMLHILVAFLLFLIVERISKDQVLGLISSLMYMIHPLNVEAVTYIAGRADPLMSVFFLLSLYLYIAKKQKALSYISFVFALLSKEIAIALPVILIFYNVIFEPPEGVKKKITPCIPYMAITAIYAALRVTILNFKYPVASIPEEVGFYERLLTSFRAVAEYFKLIILPFDLHMERVLVFSKSILQPEIFYSGLLLAIVIIIMFLLRTRHKLAFFGMGWFFITVFPLSNIPFALNATLAEHWLYVPLMGISVFAGYALRTGVTAIMPSRYRLSNILGAIIFTSIIVYFSILTINQNANWRDGDILYNYTLGYAQESPRLHYNLGNTYRESGRLTEAEQEYKLSIKADPRFHSSHFNLGLTYVNMGDTDNAITEFKKSIELEPTHYKSYSALGLAYKDKGMIDAAIAQYKKALELNQNYADAHNNLGDAYFNKKKYEDAEKEFRDALAANPNYVQAWNNLGVSLIMQGRNEEAISAWKMSLDIEPEQPVIRKYIRRNAAE